MEENDWIYGKKVVVDPGDSRYIESQDRLLLQVNFGMKIPCLNERT